MMLQYKTETVKPWYPIGTGNIFGDHIAIAANTLNNTDETVNGINTAAVIAARNRLDIGANTITNQNNALMFSAGNMAIGGALDAQYQATIDAGQTQTAKSMGLNQWGQSRLILTN